MQGDFKKSLFGANTTKRIVIFGIMTLLLGCAQCAFFPMLSICPGTPDLIMGMLLAIALIDGAKSAAVVAVCAGFFMDAIGSYGLSLSPLIYFLFVLFISLFSGKVLKSFASYLLLLIPSLIYRGAATYLCLLLRYLAIPPTSALTQIILPEALTTGLLCLPLYFIVKLCSRPLETHGRFSF